MPWLVTAPPPPHENLTFPSAAQDVRAGLGVQSHYRPLFGGVEIMDDLRLDPKLLVPLAGLHGVETALGYVVYQDGAAR